MDEEVIIAFLADVRNAVENMDELIRHIEQLDVEVQAAQRILDRFPDMGNILRARQQLLDLARAILETGTSAQEAAALARPAMQGYADSVRNLAETVAVAERYIDEATGAIAREGMTAAEAGRALRDLGYSEYFAAAGANRLADAAGAGGVGRGFAVGIGWFRLTGNTLHWLIGITFELLAVLIPAAVAAGAWAAAWMQGAQNVARHMNAVYTATEATSAMFHTTAGQAIGLGNALQVAQDKANPQVYQALGSAIDLVKEHFTGLASVGLQVGSVFDQFMAKLVADFGAGGTAGQKLDHLLANMVPDLVKLGQVFGNLGHAVFNLAGDMPGLAEVLLNVIAGVTKFINVLSGIPGGVFFAVMAFEEFNRWGGGLISLMGRMGFAGTALEGKFFTFTRFASILRGFLSIIPNLIGVFGILVGSLGRIWSGFSRAGTAIEGFSGSLLSVISKIGPLQAVIIALAAAAIGFLIYKLVTAKDATQQFADSLQQAADKATNLNVLQVLAANIGVLDAKMSALTGQVNKFASVAGNLASTGYRGVIPGAIPATTAFNTLSNAAKNQAQQFVTVATHAATLANEYKTNLVGAMALADIAGVKLNKTLSSSNWISAQIQIQGLVDGYKAMGQSAGAVNQDITALSIQAGLQASKVGQLNQAWDQFMSNLTAGTGDLAGFNNALTNMLNLPATSNINNLSRATGNLGASVKGFANDLRTFTGSGAQAWQNFDQVVGSTVPQMIDWFRTAGAEGAISGADFKKAMLDMMSQLTPLAEKSKTAQDILVGLAKDAGLNVTSFGDLVKQIKHAGANSQDLARKVQDTTDKMSNMNKVAQALSTSVQADFVASVAEAITHTSAFNQAVQNLVTQSQKFSANSPQVQGALKGIKAMLEAAGIQGDQLKTIMQGLQQYIDHMHGTNITNTVTTVWTSGVNPGPGGPTGPNPDTRRYSATGQFLTTGASAAHGLMQGLRSAYYGGIIGVGSGAPSGSRSYPGYPVQWAGGPGFRETWSDIWHGVPGPVAQQILHPHGRHGVPIAVTVNTFLDGTKLSGKQRASILTYNRRNVGNNLNLRVR